jgi:hypothetical protein
VYQVRSTVVIVRGVDGAAMGRVEAAADGATARAPTEPTRTASEIAIRVFVRGDVTRVTVEDALWAPVVA